MKRAYEDWNPRGASMVMVQQAEAICEDPAYAGLDLTLRQLYYQFVARGLLANTERNYKRLGDIVSKARMAGLLDWNHIVDRTRALRGTSHWETPSSVIDSAAYSYRLDKWTTQPTRVEVWVEKEALAGVVEQAATTDDVDYFSCRGYASQSAMYRAALRLKSYNAAGQDVVILHLGDHDPSGLDMTRDIEDRLWTFGVPKFEIRRIALNMDQVEEFQPPPNPAKMSDSRAEGYVGEYGYESWELDALDPATLVGLIASHIEGIRDLDAYQAREAQETEERETLRTIADRWEDVSAYVTSLDD